MRRIYIKLLMITLAALALALLAAGCAKPPTAEMEAATLAVTRAENNPDAVNYGANSLTQARDALDQMNAEASAKRYDSAKNLAATAISAAERAVSEGQARAAQLRQDASAAVNNLRGLLAETENTINAAKQVKDIQVDFPTVDRDFTNARQLADQAQVSLGANNYKDAVEKSQSVRSALSSINTRLADAAQTVSRKK